MRRSESHETVFEDCTGHGSFFFHIRVNSIGVGNSEFEVNYFKKVYSIPFPLFADGDFAIHKKLGEVRTPYFIGIRLAGDGTYTIYYSKLGGAGDPDALMQMLLKDSGLK